MIQKRCIVILLLIVHCAFAQRSNNSRLDTLQDKSFDYLHTQFGKSIYEPSRSKIYGAALVQKAKEEKGNFTHLTLAYKACIINADKSSRLFYADSMIYNAKKTTNSELIGSSYLTKGIVHYNGMEHMKALDNYLIADRYISQVDNPSLVHKTKYEIAKIKYYLGFYEEAIALFRECVLFYKEENDHAYLNSLHMLGLCYTRTGKYNLATETNNLSIKEGRLFEETGMEFYFEHSEGINQCFMGNYTVAIKKLNTALPQILHLKDYANEAIAYYYIGKAHWSLKQYDKAAIYFKKVDQIFKKEKYVLPDFRKGYEYLIDYYKKKDNTESQLFYINQLLKVDRLLADDYKHILTKIVKEYDTKELLNAKNEIEGTILFTRIAAGVTLVLMGIIIVYLIQKNKRNKKLFEELMKRDTANRPFSSDNNIIEETELEVPEIIEVDSNEKPARKISPEIEEAIVKKLDKFELNKRYLEKDMTVRKMAVILNTNDKYVTKIIAKHRGKGTIEYINELKLDYIIEMLKTDSRYRNYTHKALGDEAGFRTTQSFTRAFKSHTGITPTYFSYKLKKSTTTDSSN